LTSEMIEEGSRGIFTLQEFKSWMNIVFYLNRL